MGGAGAIADIFNKLQKFPLCDERVLSRIDCSIMIQPYDKIVDLGPVLAPGIVTLQRQVLQGCRAAVSCRFLLQMIVFLFYCEWDFSNLQDNVLSTKNNCIMYACLQ